MKSVLSVFVLLIAGVMTACTTVPATEHHYFLGGSVNLADQASTSAIMLAPVELASFLAQPQLVMQISEHEIQKANIHFWAENLSTAITRELLYELNQQASLARFESTSGMYKSHYDKKLAVTFHQFHPNSSSQVTLSGKYWLIDQSNSQIIISKSFSFNASLEKDGYAQAVKQLRALLQTLAKNILLSIE